MIEEEVIDAPVEGQEPEVDPSKEAPVVAPADDAVKALKAENTSLRARNAEISNSERMWAEKALKATPVAEKPKAPAEIAGPELLDMLEKEGVSGLKKLGFVSREEAEEIAEQRASAAAAQSTVFTEFPDLKRHDSDLYRVTNEILQSEDFRDIQGPGAIRMAAKQAAAKLKAPDTRKNDIDSRLAVQSGARDGATAPGPTRGVTATAEQLDFATRMGVTPKQLTEQLKASA